MKSLHKFKLHLILSALLMGTLFSVEADTLTYNDSVNQIRYANGSEISFTDPSNFDVLAVKLGWFADGFTPTLANFGSWEANFNPVVNDTVLGYNGKGALGYAISSGAATSLSVPSISVQLGVGANNLGGTSATAMPAGKLLWLIGSSVLNNDALSAGSLYSANSGTQVFAATGGLSDTTWVIPSITAEGGTTDYALSVINSSSDVIIGSYLAGTIQMAVIPEPSSMSLVVIGLASAFAFRRKALVNRKKCVQIKGVANKK